MDHRGDSRRRGGFDAVGEGEERVGGEGGSLGLLLRLPTGDADRVDAARLPGADADDRTVLGEENSVRLHEGKDAPAESEVAHLFGGRGAVGDHFEHFSATGGAVLHLNEHAAGDRTDLTRRVDPGSDAAFEDATVLAPLRAGLQSFDRARLIGGGVDHLEEEVLRTDSPGELRVERAVESDDAAEGGEGISREGRFERLGEGVALRRTARQAVLHDHRAGAVEGGGAFDRRGGVEQVVVAERLPAVDRHAGDRDRVPVVAAIPCGALVRVLAVAEIRDLLPLLGAHLGVFPVLQEAVVVRDRRVVRRGAAERGEGETATGRLGDRSLVLAKGLEERRVVARVDDHGDVREVLRGGADHRRAPDIDLLHRVVRRNPLHDLLLEGVEVHDDQIDRLDAELFALLAIGRIIAARENAAVDLRVEGLHAAAEDLGGAGVVLDRAHLDPAVAERPGGAAGGENLDAVVLQLGRELDDAGLVGDRDQRTGDGRVQLFLLSTNRLFPGMAFAIFFVSAAICAIFRTSSMPSRLLWTTAIEAERRGTTFLSPLRSMISTFPRSSCSGS